MHLSYLSFYLVQREISNAADTAARRYRESTPHAQRTAPEIWDVMTKAQEKLIKSIRTRNFEKFISVAHKDNGDDFFNEVRYNCAFRGCCFFISCFFVWHCFLPSSILM